jgi:outer membrane protein, protease secretion system
MIARMRSLGHMLGKALITRTLVVVSLFVPLPGSAQKLNLQQVFSAALSNDPTFRAALAARDAAREEQVIGRAQLLPVVSAVVSTERNRIRANEREALLASTTAESSTASNTFSETSSHTDSTGSLFSSSSSRRTNRSVQESEDSGIDSQSSSDEQFLDSTRVRSSNATLQLRQPVINFAATAAFRQGRALTAGAEARLRAQKQELMIRVAETYAQALLSTNNVQLAKAQLQTLTEQLAANERMFAGGEGTVTDTIETRAKRQLVQAQVIEAEDNLSAARNRLQVITGLPINELAPLVTTDLPSMLTEQSVEELRQTALSSNGLLESLQHQVEAANEEAKKAESGHYPRLDLIVSVGRSENLTATRATAAVDAASHRDVSSASASSASTTETSTTGTGTPSTTSSNSTSTSTTQSASSSATNSTVYRDDRNRRNGSNRSVGFELNMPLFAGGATSARVRQAAARILQSQAEKDAKVNEVLLELQRQVRLQDSTIKRVRALELAVESSRIAIDATQKSMTAGVRTNLDVLNAKERLVSVERELASARYAHLLTYLRLRFHAGVLSEDDLVAVSGR